MILIAAATSGIAALAYELVWQERCKLLLGSSGASIGLVIASFFAGLALGAILVRPLLQIRVVKRYPFVAFAAIEILVAAYGQLSLGIFEGFERYYALSQGSLTSRAFIAFIVLTLPCTLMGMAMPILARALKSVQGIYLWNTIGALIGAALCGFILLPMLGLPGALLVAMLFNVIAAGLGWLREETGSESGLACAPTETKPTTRRALSLYLLSAFVGFTTLGLEALWTRNLELVIGNTTYAFTHILTVFLLATVVSTRYLGRYWPRIAKSLWPSIFLAAALALGLSQFYFQFLPPLFVTLGEFTRSFFLVECFRWLCACVVLGPVVLLLSGLFPNLAEECVAEGGSLETFWGINLLASGLGALTVSIWLIPTIGSPWTLKLFALAYVVVGLALGKREKYQIGLAAAAVIALFALRWDWSRLDLATYVYLAPHHAGDSVFYKEDLFGNVSVVSRGKHYTLKINGKFQANTDGERTFQSRMMHFPMLFSMKPENVLTIGLGGGETAGTALLYPDVRHLDVVEISAGVIEASKKFFGAIQHGLFEDPRATIIHDDARAFLKHEGRKYDVVTIEANSMWVKGQASLWNKEFYELIAPRLTETGVMAQWIQLHHLKWENVRTALATIRAVFPYVESFKYPDVPGLVIIAARHPLAIDLSTIAKRNQNAVLRADSRANKEHEYYEYLSERAVSGPTISGITYTAMISSDYFPILEYASPTDQLDDSLTTYNSLMIQQLNSTSGLPPLAVSEDQKSLLDFFAALSRYKQANWPAAALLLNWYLEEKNWEKRERAWKEFGSPLPLESLCRYFLAIAYSRMQQPQRALTEYQRLERHSAKKPLYHYNLGRLLFLLNRPEEARKEVELGIRFANELPNEFDDGVALLMRSYTDGGKIAQAAKVFEKYEKALHSKAKADYLRQQIELYQTATSRQNAPLGE